MAWYDRFKTIEQLAASIKTLISLNFVGTTRLTVDGFLSVGTATELTISGGEVTATRSYHTIDTEGDAASDDLDTITASSIGDLLIIRAANGGRTVVAKDGTGNLLLSGDFSLTSVTDTLVLIAGSTNWIELSRSDNAA